MYTNYPEYIPNQKQARVKYICEILLDFNVIENIPFGYLSHHVLSVYSLGANWPFSA